MFIPTIYIQCSDFEYYRIMNQKRISKDPLLIFLFLEKSPYEVL